LEEGAKGLDVCAAVKPLIATTAAAKMIRFVIDQCPFPA
jgi:hypothetical protein